MLEEYLVVFYPDEYLSVQVHTARDIYDKRFLLRDITFSNSSLGYLAQILIDALHTKQRIRTLDCILVLKHILYTPGAIVKKDVIDRLFILFKHYIFSPNAEVQRHANNLIRNQRLDDEQITWLVDNYTRSRHIINRLLRYPVSNSRVAGWAREIYLSNELPDRRAELISILIADTTTLPELCMTEKADTLLWAIYYAQIPDETKKQLLLSVLTKDSLTACEDDFIKIALRLNCGSLIKEAIAKTQ